ncbi:glycosyltransferase family 2 protein [Flavicella sp.]|uniref:glycosyltransferase family 2 protein n=1 Tax=Flavicella sp. TaxID=2957742 RepID=UPI00301AEB97
MTYIKSNKPLISIITVVYNGVNEIEKTINSILEQDYDNFELIIIDGNSNDGTQNMVEKYKSKIEYYISEKDKGIYDAMNKGIKACKGTWVNFMNSGDVFHNSSVLSNVFTDNNSLNQYSLIYGYKYTNDKKSIPSNLQVLEKGIIMANHQSMFFNKNKLQEELYYDLRYPIYGDYELVNRIFIKYGKEFFKYLDLPIANYQGGGISSFISYQKRKDKYLILLRHYGMFSLISSLMYSFKQGVK